MSKILVDRELLRKVEAALAHGSGKAPEISDELRALMASSSESCDAAGRLNEALPYLRNSVAEANAEGSARLAIVSVNPDGSGRIVCKFECTEFMADLALVIGAGEQTAEDDANAEAVKFLQRHNIQAG